MVHVSVIIPMYNEERYIARCLESLSKQSYKDFEVILVDDGSTDNTIRVAQTFEKAFRFTLLQQEHGGPGKARNWGASIAQGEILVFVDADMFFDTDYIKNLINPIVEGKEIGTSHGTELVGNKENKLARAWGIVRCTYDPRFPRSNVFRAIKKEVFLAHGGFDSSKGYFDDDLSKIHRGKGSLVVKDAICYHNNLETFKECLQHSIWVGKSLLQSGAIKEYAYKYKSWILSFFIASVIVTLYLTYIGAFFMVPLTIAGIILILVMIKTIERTWKKKYTSHLLFVPLVMITRGIGYLIGMIQYLYKR